MNTRHDCDHRPAFSLVELLLVVALLGVLMAFAWPSFNELMIAGRLGDGASQLRSFLRDSRRQAMSDGIAYRVDVQLATSLLRRVPSRDDLATDDDVTSSKADDAFVPDRTRFELPDGLRIVSEEEFAKGPPEESGNGAEPPPAPDPADAGSSDDVWIPIAEFFPDGSGADATIRLLDLRGETIELNIDGLSGDVTIGETEEWLSDEARAEREEAQRDRPSDPIETTP